MTKRHSYDDLFDTPDSDFLDESLDIEEAWCQRMVEDDVRFCDFGFGDADSFCIRDKYGCHYEGCPIAEVNE